MGKLFGAQAIVKCLEREGIELFLGIPGLYNMPIFDALYRHLTIKTVTTRHEQGAAFMADGYYRASGKPAAICTLPGPGLTNAMTGIGEAYADSSNMLVVSTTVNREFIDQDRGLLHELTGQFEMLDKLCKFSERIAAPAEISGAFSRAMRALHNGRPRPVQLEIPRDVQVGRFEWDGDIEAADRSPKAAATENIEQAVEMLIKAKRPLIYAGGGVIASRASKPLTELAERLGAITLTTGMGVGSISGDHPLNCGVAWIAGGDIRPLVAACDAFLAIGSRFNNGMTADWELPLPATTIRIDIDPVEIERNLSMKVKLVGDAGETLRHMLGLLPAENRSVHPTMAAARQIFRNALKAKVGKTRPWMDALRKGLPRNAILSCDMSLFWADMLSLFPFYQPRTNLFPWGYGTLGFALPEALGAKLAAPDRPVAAIAGDGAFLFTGAELATAIQYGLNIPIILPNNNAYGMIKVQQRDHFDEQYMAVDLVNPDFVQLARAFGAIGERVESPQSLGYALEKALKADRPTLIEIPWDWRWGNES